MYFSHVCDTSFETGDLKDTMSFKVNFLGLFFYFIFKVRLQVTSKYLVTSLSNDCSRSLLAKALFRELG